MKNAPDRVSDADQSGWEEIGGVRFTVTNAQSAADWVISRAVDGDRPTPVRLSNAWCVVEANRDPAYREILNGPGRTFPDGTPIVWAMRMVRGTRAGRVRGPSLFVDVLDRGRQSGLSHLFIGGAQETLDRLTTLAQTRLPGLKIASAWSPPFGPLDEAFFEAAHNIIVRYQPDIVWIGLGTPKQDFAAATLAKFTSKPIVGVGAAFDFFAGTKPEAPRWVQRLGVEWLFRLATEPRRLWRRYLLGNFQFVWFVLRGALRK